MGNRREQLKLPAMFTAGSFLCLILLVLLTNPVNDISYVMLFFGVLLLFLISLGYGLLILHSGEVSRKTRSRLIIISVFITLLVMFNSAGSLGWVDGLVLALITGGLLFYSGRRAE